MDAVHTTLEAINTGRCNVVEKGHFLILGWTDACYMLIREIALAMEDKKAVIVILCSHDSQTRKEVLARIHSMLPESCRLDIILRNGHPSSVTDLMTVAVCHARRIVIPAPQACTSLAWWIELGNRRRSKYSWNSTAWSTRSHRGASYPSLKSDVLG